MQNGEKFVFYKNEEIFLMKKKLMAKIMYRFSKEVFMDGTFFSSSKLSYQLVVIRVYAAPLKKYFTVTIGLMKNKTKELYMKILEKTKENIKTFYQQYNNEQEFIIKNFHCDFEEGLYRAALNLFPHITIKFCYWHFQQLMEKKRKTF